MTALEKLEFTVWSKIISTKKSLFYGEGFLKFYTYSNDFSTVFGDIVTSDNKSFFETAIGVGIGWKWISNSGFLIDISAGLGRNLGFANDPEERDLAGKFGINFGWQF